jgi:hypothetical protein
MFLFSAVLFSGALLTSALIGAAPAGAASGGSFPCISWNVQTPYSGYGVVASTVSGTCVTDNGFGEVYVVVKLWDLEHDGKYHLITTIIRDASCGSAGSFTLCTFNFLANTPVAPPVGRYHAELEVIGGYASQAPGEVFLDDANSGVFCDHC